jgi:hypothetical protein
MRNHLLTGLLFALCTQSYAGGNELIFKDGFEQARWIDVTGTSFWQCSANCSVQNNLFVEAGAGMTITATGSWNVGLRPTAIRVDASLSPMFELAAGLLPGGNNFGSCRDYVANSACALQVNADIQRLNLYISGTIRKIELLVP